VPIRRRAARWAEDHKQLLADRDPDVPDRLSDRAADNWRPLLAIAELAGEDWAARATRAALELSGLAVDEDSSPGVQLLFDLYQLFRQRLAEFPETWERAATEILLKYLVSLEERRWKDWNRGRPLDARALAKLLEPYGIRSKNLKERDPSSPSKIQVRKGYELSDFRDTWRRYLAATVAADPLPGEEVGSGSSATGSGLVADADDAISSLFNQVAEVADREGIALTMMEEHPPESGQVARSETSSLLPDSLSSSRTHRGTGSATAATGVITHPDGSQELTPEGVAELRRRKRS
jgi:hypothetical protein